GVGSIAVALLAKTGYRVAAATGKTEADASLRELGAVEVLEPKDVDDTPGKPLLAPRWAGAGDTGGGTILATPLRAREQRGAVAGCGLVASPELQLTVFPCILRSVSLLGVDSVTLPSMELRRCMWWRLGGEWKLPRLERLARE